MHSTSVLFFAFYLFFHSRSLFIISDMSSSSASASASSMSMSSTIVYQAIGMGAMALVFVLVYCCRRRSTRGDLRTPLLAEEQLDHRVDVASREAEAGATCCDRCGFDNFKRSMHCVMCGDQLLANAAARSSPTNGVSSLCGRLIKGVCRRQEALTHESATRDDKTAPVERPLTSRQLRIRRRREWARTLVAVEPTEQKEEEENEKNGGTNALRWHHERSVAAGSPGVVARFGKAPGGDPEVTTESILTALRDEIEAEQLVIEDAAVADAAAFARGECDPNDEQVRAALRLAGADFPTKLAHFVVSTASLLVPANVEYLKLSLHRTFVLEHSIDHLCCIQDKHLHTLMRISFMDETAVDAGGVHREWLMLLHEQLVSPMAGLFVCRNRSEQSYYLNPNSAFDVGEHHLSYYHAIGRLLGRTLLEGSTWGFHLSYPLLKIILGQPVTLEDLEWFDPELHQSLRWLLENSGVDALGLDFTVSERTGGGGGGGGSVVTHELIPNGADVTVTDDNKLAFVQRRLEHALFESVSTQLSALLRGVYDIIPFHLLLPLDAEELDYLLCGTDEVDVADWRAHTVHSLNLYGTRVMDWFWEEVAAMPNEARRRLLHFATGSSRVPIAGFQGLTSHDGRLCPFTLTGVAYHRSKYISSRSCFNRLELPLYRSREEFRAVLYALLDGDIYGFTIV
ncbi:hypothetical protein PINS_up015576 [Pythium insidiosum]|nr:hypothetical protein PINS_up015576 [Pythium insidiosum]